jgi:hypothetical protein
MDSCNWYFNNTLYVLEPRNAHTLVNTNAGDSTQDFFWRQTPRWLGSPVSWPCFTFLSAQSPNTSITWLFYTPRSAHAPTSANFTRRYVWQPWRLGLHFLCEPLALPLGAVLPADSWDVLTLLSVNAANKQRVGQTQSPCSSPALSLNATHTR